MAEIIDESSFEKRRRALERSMLGADNHEFFKMIADARFVMRRVFRIIEEGANRQGLDSTPHQALIQLYGSENMQLRIKEMAERLNVSPAFASSLVRTLVAKKLAVRRRGKEDKREAMLAITQEGVRVLARIDQDVKVHIGYFNLTLTQHQREATVMLPMQYMKMAIRIDALHPAEKAGTR